MKKFQNNFTTPEQSKRLLKLGVPAWTADLYFYEEDCISNNDEPSGVIPYDEVYEDNSKETTFSSYVELPCWSVGRLVEIYCLCSRHESVQFFFYKDENLINSLIAELADNVNQNKMWNTNEYIDFSKLEE